MDFSFSPKLLPFLMFYTLQVPHPHPTPSSHTLTLIPHPHPSGKNASASVCLLFLSLSLSDWEDLLRLDLTARSSYPWTGNNETFWCIWNAPPFLHDHASWMLHSTRWPLQLHMHDQLCGFSSFVNLMMTQGGVEWQPDPLGDKVSVYGRKPYEFKDSPLFVQELKNLLCN